jgi:phosphatidylserine/phosphatidylglycerophosphate/cardiolipin synthase-like enzyme
VSIIVEPSDNAAALKAAIAGAHSSVHMTMYLLSNSGIINALIARKQAGVEVKVLLNQTFPDTSTSNSSVFTQLQNAGVQVQWAPSTFTLTHEKCVIIDGSTAWIMTMNATASSPTSNREYLAVDTQPADVQEAEAVFQADWSGMAITPNGALLVAPTTATSKLLAALNGATSTIDIEAEELSDYNVVNTLVTARGRGVVVKIVLADGTPSSAQLNAQNQLKSSGVSIVTLHYPYVHAKSAVVDGTSAYVGSENFTTASLQHNRELGLLVTNASEVQKVLMTTHADFAAGTAL